MTTLAEVESCPSGITPRVADSWFKDRLAVITIVGAVWRVGYLVMVKSDDELKYNSSLYYSIQAILNSEGHWFQDGLNAQPGAEHGFLTSLYLTPWSLGGGDPVLRQRFAVTLVGIMTIVIVGLVGRRLGTVISDRMERWDRFRGAERLGLVAAAIAALYPNFWIHDSLVMSETIAIFIASCALFVAIGHHDTLTIRSAIPLGVVAGLGALTRSELVLAIAGFTVVTSILCRRRRLSRAPAFALALAGILTVLPWSLYNLSRFHEPTWLSTNDGTALLGANCDATYYIDVGGWDVSCLAGTLEPAISGSDVSDSSDRADHQRDLALTYMDEHFSRIPVVAAARVGRLLDVYGLSALVTLDEADEKAAWAAWAGIVCWWILAVLAIAGWRLLSRRGVGVRWWFAVPVIGVVITTILFYGAHRIRAPSEPAVVLIASVAVVAMWEWTLRRVDSRDANRSSGDANLVLDDIDDHRVTERALAPPENQDSTVVLSS